MPGREDNNAASDLLVQKELVICDWDGEEIITLENKANVIKKWLTESVKTTVSVAEHHFRILPSIFNDMDDIDKLIDVLSGQDLAVSPIPLTAAVKTSSVELFNAVSAES